MRNVNALFIFYWMFHAIHFNFLWFFTAKWFLLNIGMDETAMFCRFNSRYFMRNFNSSVVCIRRRNCWASISLSCQTDWSIYKINVVVWWKCYRKLFSNAEIVNLIQANSTTAHNEGKRNFHHSMNVNEFQILGNALRVESIQ